MNLKLQKKRSVKNDFWKDTKLFVNGKEVPWGEQATVFREQSNTVSIKKTGAKELMAIHLSNENDLDLVLNPLSGDWVSPVEGVYNWEVNASRAKSGWDSLIFVIREDAKLRVHDIRVISPRFVDEVKEIQVDGKPYPAKGIVFLRGVQRTLSVIYNEDSPMRGYPTTLTTTVFPPLKPGDMQVSGWGLDRWNVTGKNNSGPVNLDLAAEQMVGMTLEGSRVLSPDMNGEVDLLVNGTPIPPDGATMNAGQSYEVSAVHKNGNAMEGIPLSLEVVTDTGNKPEDFRSEPTLGAPTVDHLWNLKVANSTAGIYKLKLANDVGMTDLVSPSIILLPAPLKPMFMALIGGQYQELPQWPIWVKVPAGFYLFTIEARYPDRSPVVGAFVKMDNPADPEKPLTGTTGTNGRKIFPVSLLPGVYDITAVATAQTPGREEYPVRLRLEAGGAESEG